MSKWSVVDRKFKFEFNPCDWQIGVAWNSLTQCEREVIFSLPMVSLWYTRTAIPKDLGNLG